MRWFARIAVALTLSSLAVAALTWAGWPQSGPRFTSVVTNVPPMQGLEALVHRVSAEFGTVDTQPPEVAPRQWLGFIRWTMHSAGNANGLLTLVNLDDGRACDPWDGTDLGRPLPDARGVPVTTRRAASQVPGGGSLGLIDPTTGAFREFAGDRDGQFFMSGNGETVLTFSVPRAEDAAGDADADLVCFDLTQDPPARVRIDGVVPGHRITRQYTRNADGGWGYRPFTYERADGVGGVALSPDGRTLAVSE